MIWLAEHLNKHMQSASCIGNIQMLMSHASHFRFSTAAGKIHFNWGKHNFIQLDCVPFPPRENLVYWSQSFFKSLSNKIATLFWGGTNFCLWLWWHRRCSGRQPKVWSRTWERACPLWHHKRHFFHTLSVNWNKGTNYKADLCWFWGDGWARK